VQGGPRRRSRGTRGPALSVCHGGVAQWHRTRLRNRRSWLESRRGVIYFREAQQCCCVRLTQLRCLCVEKKNKGIGRVWDSRLGAKLAPNLPLCKELPSGAAVSSVSLIKNSTALETWKSLHTTISTYALNLNLSRAPTLAIIY
jgi:hypothetical protein